MKKQQMDFAAMPRTAVEVVTSPAAFFREMPKTGGFVEPVAFLLVLSAATAVVNAVLGLLGLIPFLSAGMAIAGIVLLPAVMLVAGFIWAGIVFAVWKAIGSAEPFETSYRCVAYLTALMPVTAIINLVPYAGFVIVIAGMTWYYVIASVETHKVPAQKAWIAFGIIGAVMLLMGITADIASRSARHSLEGKSQEMQQDMDQMRKQLDEMQKRMPKQ